jgi:hypothetical protein
MNIFNSFLPKGKASINVIMMIPIVFWAEIQPRYNVGTIIPEEVCPVRCHNPKQDFRI